MDVFVVGGSDDRVISAFTAWTISGTMKVNANHTSNAPTAHAPITFLENSGSFTYGVSVGTRSAGGGGSGSRSSARDASLVGSVMTVSPLFFPYGPDSRKCQVPSPAAGDKPAGEDYNFGMITTAKIEGMSCAHCVRAVFTALGGVPGVARADVSIGKAIIEHDGSVTLEALREAISIAGYEVAEFRDDRRALPVV